MKWAAIISFCLMVFGRYIIKGVKWVNKNQSHN